MSRRHQSSQGVRLRDLSVEVVLNLSLPAGAGAVRPHACGQEIRGRQKAIHPGAYAPGQARGTPPPPALRRR